MAATTRKPARRSLRGYAFDPSLSLKLDTVGINEITYRVPWEDLVPPAACGSAPDRADQTPPSPQGPGPVGEYVEVIDYDPTVQQHYKPVDLNDLYIVASSGLDPSESNPQFHQQMVYAVAMTTIGNFEAALGRKVMWSSHRLPKDSKQYEEYVQRLRIYPHALRDANAYYSPHKKALLFGYFSASPADSVRHVPNALVYTCLSHDIIAHETTHAILDGMFPLFNEATNPDVLAFHEAIADIVALFQHFTFPEVLKHQIAKTRGDLASQNLLGQLAQEFGAAIGRYGSLRDAIGEEDILTKQWKIKQPDPEEYQRETEPHVRGSILVAAVFEAFLTIYKSRIADLLRLAAGPAGELPKGELHPDLVNRLCAEAAKSSKHVLHMCIRALDYCPPLDITFGDYLRALITADSDLVAEDDRDYRLCFIDAFRRRGIYPTKLKALSVESLRYTKHPNVSDGAQSLFRIIADFLRDYREAVCFETDRRKIYEISRLYIRGGKDAENRGVQGLHQRITGKFGDSREFAELTGLAFGPGWGKAGIADSDNGSPRFQVENLRLVSRVGPNGRQINQIVFSLLQRTWAKVEDGEVTVKPPVQTPTTPEGYFTFKGGCTLIFDLDDLSLRYAISKPLIDLERKGKMAVNEERVREQEDYQNYSGLLGLSDMERYFGMGLDTRFSEPFALLHQH